MRKERFVYMKFWETDPATGRQYVTYHRFKTWDLAVQWTRDQAYSADGEQCYRRATRSEYDNGSQNNPVDTFSARFLSGVGCPIIF